jgi:hypothetical protein
MIRATSTILVLRSKGSWTTNTHVEVVVATSEDGLASGNAEHGPRDVAGVRRRGKEHEGGCDLTGLASPSERCHRRISRGDAVERAGNPPELHLPIRNIRTMMRIDLGTDS